MVAPPPEGRPDAKVLTEVERRDAATEYLGDWWNSQDQLLYYAPDDVEFVYLGEADPDTLKGNMAVGTRHECPDTKVYVFYLIAPSRGPRGYQISIAVLGCATAEMAVNMGDGQIRLDRLLQRCDMGYAEFYAKRPKLVKVSDAVHDGESGAVVQRELWRYDFEIADQIECTERRRLFIFPVRSVAIPWLGGSVERVPKHVQLRRNAWFIGEAGWDNTVGEKEQWAIWDEEARPTTSKVAADGYRPAALQVLASEHRALLSAYFVGGVSAALWPALYAETRAKVEHSYLRYQLTKGGFDAREDRAIQLLEHNGCYQWIAGLATDADKQLFSRLHPAHALPRYAGWIPVAKCPPRFVLERGMTRGNVRFFYPDIAPVVARLMELDQRLINSFVEEAPQRFIEADPTVLDIWSYTEDVIAEKRDGVKDIFGARGTATAASNSKSIAKGGNELELTLEQLVAYMPPCMRRMVESAQRTPRYLRDGERHWFARFLKGLGYSESTYNDLLRPHFNAERTALGLPHGDGDWTVAWDAKQVFQKKDYSKPTCARVVENTFDAPGTRINPATKAVEKGKMCICPYARTAKFRNPDSDIENLASAASKMCFDDWAKTNPSKVRETEKPLYYPQQHIYYNMRRDAGQRTPPRPRIEIEYEEEEEEQDRVPQARPMDLDFD